MIHLMSRLVVQFPQQQQQPVTPMTATPTVQQPIPSVVQQPNGSHSVTSYDGLTDELTDYDLLLSASCRTMILSIVPALLSNFTTMLA